MKNLFYVIIAGVLFFSCNNQEAVQENSISSKDGVFIHITESYNNAHRVLMPMKMATLMADDKDVLVYMDIKAVELLVNDAEDLELEGFDSFRTYLSILNEKGVGVYACPSCLKVAGHNPEELIEGVLPAQKDKFFNFTKGRIITLDY